MRKLLTSLVPLFVVAGLTAQEPTPTVRKEEGTAPPMDVQRRTAELRKQLAGLEDKAAALQQARNEQIADYKVKLATLEAENKVKIANLDRDSQRIAAMAEHVNRELMRIVTQARNQPAGDGTQPPERRGFGEPRGRRAVQRSGQTDASARPTEEQMLDKVMKKLEEMDQRLRQVEARTRRNR